MITKRPFGTLEDGTAVSLWELTNERGLTAQVLDYGVTIRSVLVPDKRGKLVDVVLGYDTLKEYVRDGCYLGTTVGRCANRIKGASFELNGKTYPLYANNGENHLHGGKRGFNKYVWNGEQTGEAVTFSRLSPDGEEGYPGNLQVQVTIGWEGDSLTIRYEATTDQDTVVNLTNHSYFNLNGKGKINGHLLQVAADHYTLNGRDGIPTGEVVSVEGSAMDFRTPKTIGQDAGKKEPCVSFFNGYDSNFIISGHPFATAVGDKTGITLIADTDQPGVQLYTANALGPRLGKKGSFYGFRSGFCLETQNYPDAIHHPQWPSCILKAGETYRSVTTYTFR
jgi:aldose 1-epimerase